jgi:excisionase family DNA binding protein
MLGKGKKAEEKILDVDASMQGTMSFKDPVNLQINGRFEGTLDTKGTLMIGEKAFVSANIVGDEITIAGRVTGEVVAKRSLKLISPARVDGNIRTPLLEISKGAVLNGNCQMVVSGRVSSQAGSGLMEIDEVARYLEVDSSVVRDWAVSGKLPAIREGDKLHFDKAKIDEWITSERIK